MARACAFSGCVTDIVRNAKFFPLGGFPPRSPAPPSGIFYLRLTHGSFAGARVDKIPRYVSLNASVANMRA
jgi:hypothetical protein